VVLKYFVKARAVATGFVSAKAPDGDGHARGDLGYEFDGLARVSEAEKFLFVTVKELLALAGVFEVVVLEVGELFGARSESVKPDIKKAIRDPAAFGYPARRATRDADAQALVGLGWSADLEGGEVEFLRHVSHFTAQGYGV
jgi:hypothetical protein